MSPLPLFFSSLAATLLLAPLLSFLPIHPLAAALVLCVQRLPQIRCLQLALLAGSAIDLLSGQGHLGLFATSYSGTTLLLHYYRHHLFHDTVWALPLMTWVFSMILASVSMLLGHPSDFGLSWLFSDLLFLPLFDGAYAFLLFAAIPPLLGGRLEPVKHPLATRPR